MSKRKELVYLALENDLELDESWSGLDAVLPLIDLVVSEGAVVNLDSEPDGYSIFGSAGHVSPFQGKGSTMEEPLAEFLCLHLSSPGRKEPGNYRNDSKLRDDQVQLQELASPLGVELPVSWQGVDTAWPLWEVALAEGASLMLKFDGQRELNRARHTIMIRRGRLSLENFQRSDTFNVADGFTRVLLGYFQTSSILASTSVRESQALTDTH